MIYLPLSISNLLGGFIAMQLFVLWLNFSEYIFWVLYFFATTRFQIFEFALELFSFVFLLSIFFISSNSSLSVEMLFLKLLIRFVNFVLPFKISVSTFFVVDFVFSLLVSDFGNILSLSAPRATIVTVIDCNLILLTNAFKRSSSTISILFSMQWNFSILYSTFNFCLTKLKKKRNWKKCKQKIKQI